ncbi:MAG: UvrB/UvrC motif-containing protein [Verrucomicrobia bacterium]|nr:UvrB/UvrC motif-containing protein [Verrucomicrobiota bacterium]
MLEAGMKCELCHKEEATIHFTQVIDGEAKKLNLCQKCAQKSGIDLNSPISITDVLFGLGALQEPALSASAEFDLSCVRCGMTRAEFKKNARLGCPECYNAFMAEIATLTQAMHHSGQHVGKIPARQGTEARINAQIAALQKDLETAIDEEQYEIAANIRDKINALKESVLNQQNEESGDD